jgi:tetratricopeptide (TPR) repeat protein
MAMQFRRYFAAGLLAITQLSSSAYAMQSEEELARRADVVNRAAELIGKDPGQVIELLKPVIAAFEADHKDNPDTFFCASTPAETLMVLGTAAADKKDAVAIDGTYCDALFITGFSLIDLDRQDDAKAFLQNASDRAPYNGHYMNELAEWHKRKGDWQTAYALFDRASGLGEFAPSDYKNEQTARALRGMGFSLIEMGKLDDAETKFKQSLKLEPKNPSAKHELQYIKEQRAVK